MALVDYSDSDDSERGEATPVLKPSAKPSKRAFHKVVDRSNPGKARVSLPRPFPQDQQDDNGHPIKRVKTGNGGLNDFKTFLPPPKRIKDHGDHDAGELSLSPTSTSLQSSQKPAEKEELVGKPLMFKPLSITRNPVKKNKQSQLWTNRSTHGTTPRSSTTANVDQVPQNPKVSLFSTSLEPRDPTFSEPTGGYRPMIYETNIDETQPSELPASNADSNDNEYMSASQSVASISTTPIAGAQSLSDIASDLNLSVADRRQLFGRQKGRATAQATKVINFNTDEEYRHNEELRAAGEQVVHNPVRSIAPGKHSLKQLVNAVTSQETALKESFAEDRSKRTTASRKYGW